LIQHYNDTINWAFTTKVKDLELAASDEGAGLATVQGNGNVSLDIPVKLTNLVSFFQGMKLRYNDGLGTQDIVTFLGADFVEDMQLKCKIQLSNDLVILVDIEILNFMENPNIASIPETSEDYFWECMVITPSQLEHILHPKAFSPPQEEMMSHHYQLHHLPFPQLIVMAESGEIPHCVASLKGCCPICVPCQFGQAHKQPWQSKSKEIHLFKKSWMIILV
jgi:hypothetical protein